MKHQDLGQLEGPVLLFGGPYSNLHALEALIDQAGRRGIPPQNCICTGDIVAYCAYPSETVARIREFGCAVVAGNCEIQLAANAMSCGCGFEEGTTCDLLSAAWYAHADKNICAADREWMADLPGIISFSHAGRRYAVIHGGLSNISRFLWPVSAQEDFAEEIARIGEIISGVNYVISGHCGMSFKRVIDGIEWLNAGVIGMPANNGRTATEYAVLSAGQAQIFPLEYDHQAAHEAMKAAGLTQGYQEALLTGYWPSEDVLPSSLRRVAS
ncbi:MAG: metallophosphoesterase family protein [Pseudomonadota bacterium]